MATQWKIFKTAMKQKRTGKRKAPSHDIAQKEEIVIQRLSTEVWGKAQKYSCIVPQEFVPLAYKEATLDTIKNACRRHFASRVGECMICNVQQIPDLKIVHMAQYFHSTSHSICDVQVHGVALCGGSNIQRKQHEIR